MQVLFIFRCDADPTTLAKYVLALVKKNRPEVELRETCKDQLEVFLQQSKLKTMCSLTH